uniref:Reverse transcriptase domain-containing protein n=1 Tax=Biomphalaria glabrata TaxID=6526 RepID=A0A2C9KMS6_BIOGL
MHSSQGLPPKACSDVILGLDFISLHENLQIPFSGKRPPLCVSTLTPAKVEAPSLFGNLSPNCTPVATKSRRYSLEDSKFINAEIQRLLKEEVIEPSKSPWRAQVLITANERHKRRMVIDYSQTINRFTLLDACPMPRMDELAEKIAQFLSSALWTSRMPIIRSRLKKKKGHIQLSRLGRKWSNRETEQYPLESYNLALHSQDLSTSQWELVLQDALHSIRSLLCTATNKTPHERLFGYYRRSTSGTSLPTWLKAPGPVLLKRNNRSSKYDPLTKEVELVNSNPQYALIKTSTGREETVSLRLLAPKEKDCFTENVRTPVLRDGSSRNVTPSLQCETENNAENSSLNPPVNRTTKPPLLGEVDPVKAPTIKSPSNVVSTDTDSTNSADPNCRYNLRERKSRPNYRV